jgi:hypothetical protein
VEHKLDFTFYFSSIGLEESYNGTVVSVEKCHFVYDSQDIENCILIKYGISNLDWDQSLSQEDITQLVISESDLFVETFSLLLINPCKLLLYKIFVDDVEFKPKFPVQSLGGIFNLLVERNKLSASRSITTLVHKNGWAVLEKLVTEFHVRPVTNKNKIRLVLRWCAKASNEYSSIDRLVSYWISFNSLFEGLDDKEQKSIEKYIDNNVDSQIAQRFYTYYQKQLSTLASLKIELRNRRKVSDDLSILLSANVKDYISIVKMMVLVIYGIRNNLFHGSYDPDSSQTNKNIIVAERLLSEFMKEIVAKEMVGYPLASSVFRLQTKVGIG